MYDASSEGSSPPQVDADAAFRSYRHLLAQGLLAVLLPPGDLRNPCLRALVSEVSADLVIGNFIGARFSESVFIYDMIRRVADIIQPRSGHHRWAIDITNEPQDRLSRFGLLVKSDPTTSGRTVLCNLCEILSLVCQYALLAITVLRAAIRIFMAAPSLTSRRTHVYRDSVKGTPAMPENSSNPSIEADWSTPSTDKIQPIIDYAAWPAIADIACLESRVPWVLGSVTLLHQLLSRATISFGELDGRLDRSVLIPLNSSQPDCCRQL